MRWYGITALIGLFLVCSIKTSETSSTSKSTDAEVLDCYHRIALALECINRHMSQIREAVQAAQNNKEAHETVR